MGLGDKYKNDEIIARGHATQVAVSPGSTAPPRHTLVRCSLILFKILKKEDRHGMVLR
ncbi:MAG: hypothetical protein HYT37_03230 [Candidatus Sungbacteria bacterium]|nr:hypothetical protein [Candidatus Sungbacteria bacterium]